MTAKLSISSIPLCVVVEDLLISAWLVDTRAEWRGQGTAPAVLGASGPEHANYFTKVEADAQSGTPTYDASSTSPELAQRMAHY
jgi:hypothetical protein